MNRFLIVLVIFSVCTSCIEKIDFPVNESLSEQLVVEGGLNSAMYSHRIILSRTGKVTGSNPFRPVSGADVSVFDGESLYLFTESESQPGYYFSDSLAVDPAKTYRLTIDAGGERYEAEASAIAPRPFDPVEYYPFAGGPIAGENPQGYYSIDLPGNFGGREPYLYSLTYEVPDEWKDNFPYPIPPGLPDLSQYDAIDTTYLVHPWIETAALFEYGETSIVGLPLGTEIREGRAYLSDEYYNFLRALLMETDWRGANILQTLPANIPTNLSNGALGFFYVLDSYEVVSRVEE